MFVNDTTKKILDALSGNYTLEQASATLYFTSKEIQIMDYLGIAKYVWNMNAGRARHQDA